METNEHDGSENHDGSGRDMGKVAKAVLTPFAAIAKAFSLPSEAMRRRKIRQAVALLLTLDSEDIPKSARADLADLFRKAADDVEAGDNA